MVNRIYSRNKANDNERAIITADIVNSSGTDQAEWMPLLQTIKQHYTAELYRGDSFQLRCKNISDSIFNVIHIKAAIKTLRYLDIRISIGIGDETFSSDSVAESGGDAYERSGKGLDLLTNEKNLTHFDSGNEIFDQEINVLLNLLCVITTRWKPSQAKAMERLLRYGRGWSKKTTQKELAALLKIKPNTLSTQFSQANKNTVMAAENLLHNKLLQQFND